jgi:hypothetical protein
VIAAAVARAIEKDDAGLIQAWLERWIAGAVQRRVRGTVSVVPLSTLPRLIAGTDREAVGRSVLRAA